MTRCLQYLQAQTQQKLLIQASSCTSPHRATHSGEDRRKRSRHASLHVYSWAVSVPPRAPLLAPERPFWGAEWTSTTVCVIIWHFHRTAEVIIPHLSVLPWCDLVLNTLNTFTVTTESFWFWGSGGRACWKLTQIDQEPEFSDPFIAWNQSDLWNQTC